MFGCEVVLMETVAQAPYLVGEQAGRLPPSLTCCCRDLPLSTASWRRLSQLAESLLGFCRHPAWLVSSGLLPAKISITVAITCTCEPNPHPDYQFSFVRLASIFLAVSPAVQPTQTTTTTQTNLFVLLLLLLFAFHLTNPLFPNPAQNVGEG